jgi:hypothetical protein
MRIALNVLARALDNRRSLLIVASVMTVAVLGCRGGGANPSLDDRELPRIVPTASSTQCVDKLQPEGAPQFADIDASRFQDSEIAGLRYYDIAEGTGDTPEVVDAVSVEYTGWLTNGCMFDTSYINDGPVTFPLLNVIEGWQAAFTTMKEGGVRVIEIAPDLAYGATGRPPRIPPNATLIFRAELLSRITLAEAQATVAAEQAVATAEAESIFATATAEAELTPVATP